MWWSELWLHLWLGCRRCSTFKLWHYWVWERLIEYKVTLCLTSLTTHIFSCWAHSPADALFITLFTKPVCVLVSPGQTVELLERPSERPGWCLVRTTDRTPVQEGLVPSAALCVSHSRSSVEMDCYFSSGKGRKKNLHFYVLYSKTRLKKYANILKYLLLLWLGILPSVLSSILNVTVSRHMKEVEQRHAN